MREDLAVSLYPWNVSHVAIVKFPLMAFVLALVHPPWLRYENKSELILDLSFPYWVDKKGETLDLVTKKSLQITIPGTTRNRWLFLTFDQKCNDWVELSVKPIAPSSPLTILLFFSCAWSMESEGNARLILFTSKLLFFKSAAIAGISV